MEIKDLEDGLDTKAITSLNTQYCRCGRRNDGQYEKFDATTRFLE